MACNKLLLSRPRSTENTLAERMMKHVPEIEEKKDDGNDESDDYNWDSF